MHDCGFFSVPARRHGHRKVAPMDTVGGHRVGKKPEIITTESRHGIANSL
jgi:hypothetical protein